jgi:hypothetical protein
MNGSVLRHRRMRVFATLAGGLILGLTLGAAAAPSGTPGPPSGVTAAPRDQGAMVNWNPPSSDGGSAITAYVITASPGGKTVRTTPVTSFLVGGLTNGTAYTFTVAAVNRAGTGPTSRPSAAATPAAPTVPGPAGSVKAAAGFEQASVSWAAPASDGGAPVTAYSVTASPGTAHVSVSGSARSATLTGLKDGTSYGLLVAAVNSVGAGRAVASAAVTPQMTVPGTPTGVTAAPTTTGVSVSWQPPLSDGGSAVSGYVIAVAGTSKRITTAPTARSATITGLTSGTSYTFRVAAKNAKGPGPRVTSTPATAGATVTPKTVVLSQASLTTLTRVGTDGSLVFTSPPEQVKNLIAGDIVAAGVSPNTPGGLLAKVTSVSASGSTVTADTVPTSLDQALSATGFGIRTTLTRDQVAAFTPARPGVRLMPPDSQPADCPAPGFSVVLNTTLYQSSNGQSGPCHLTNGARTADRGSPHSRIGLGGTRQRCQSRH